MDKEVPALIHSFPDSLLPRIKIKAKRFRVRDIKLYADKRVECTGFYEGGLNDIVPGEIIVKMDLTFGDALLNPYLIFKGHCTLEKIKPLDKS